MYNTPFHGSVVSWKLRTCLIIKYQPHLCDKREHVDVTGLIAWTLTHWGREKTAAILQTKFSYPFSSEKGKLYSALNFYWYLLIIIKHWLPKWFVACSVPVRTVELHPYTNAVALSKIGTSTRIEHRQTLQSLHINFMSGLQMTALFPWGLRTFAWLNLMWLLLQWIDPYFVELVPQGPLIVSLVNEMLAFVLKIVKVVLNQIMSYTIYLCRQNEDLRLS